MPAPGPRTLIPPDHEGDDDDALERQFRDTRAVLRGVCIIFHGFTGLSMVAVWQLALAVEVDVVSTRNAFNFTCGLAVSTVLLVLWLIHHRMLPYRWWPLLVPAPLVLAGVAFLGAMSVSATAVTGQ